MQGMVNLSPNNPGSMTGNRLSDSDKPDLALGQQHRAKPE
jgi:hypothetical protein